MMRSLYYQGMNSYTLFKVLNCQFRVEPQVQSKSGSLRIAIMHCGGPCAGMNPAVRALVRLGIKKGHSVLAMYLI